MGEEGIQVFTFTDNFTASMIFTNTLTKKIDAVILCEMICASQMNLFKFNYVLYYTCPSFAGHYSHILSLVVSCTDNEV